MTARSLGGMCSAVAVMLWSAGAQAQSAPTTGPAPEQIETRTVAIGLRGAGDQGAGTAVTWTAAAPAQMDFDILAGPLDLGRGAVKGAPYSAEAVNEVVQTLTDGNRIARSSTTAVYRDAAGRTRREQGLAVIGPLVAGPEAMKQIVITDPDARVTYLLEPATRTARRMPMPQIGPAMLASPGVPVPPPALLPPAPPGSGGDVLFFETAVPPPAGAAVARTFTVRRFDSGNGPAEASESLGNQMVEGVLAEGTRTTITIPAGQIGNERPISIVSERWFSPELKALVLSKQSDPRFGETTYRLSNIVLGDPDPSLFEVPADFQVVEAGGAGDIFFRRRVP